jgi:hypothetical protein
MTTPNLQGSNEARNVMATAYLDLIAAKRADAPPAGFEPFPMNAALKDHQIHCADFAVGAAFPLLGAGMMQAGKAAYMPVRAIRELATNKPDIARAEAALFTRINEDLGPEARRALIAADARARGKSEAEVEALLAKDSGHSAADELELRYRKSRSLGGSNPALLAEIPSTH